MNPPFKALSFLMLCVANAACSTSGIKPQKSLSKAEWTVSEYYCPIGCLPYDDTAVKAMIGRKIVLQEGGITPTQFGNSCPKGILVMNTNHSQVSKAVEAIDKQFVRGTTGDASDDLPHITIENSKLGLDSNGRQRDWLMEGAFECQLSDGRSYTSVNFLSIEKDRLIVLLPESVFVVLQ